MNDLMLEVRFVFISEGPSEEPLVQHFERLCVEAGASEAMGLWVDFRRVPESTGKKVEDQFGYLVRKIEDFDYDIVFIHRDSDSRDDAHTRRVIATGVEKVRPGTMHVAVVPVQALEAWLLVDSTAIRYVSGNPRGRSDLKLPKPSKVELVHDPKKRLREAIALAAEESGTRHHAIMKRFPGLRRALLERIDHEGPILQVPSWQKLLSDIRCCVEKIKIEKHSSTD